MDKEAKRTGNVYHYERTKTHDTRGFKEMMRMGNSTKFCNQLNHISEKSAQRWLGMVYVVWLDFQQLRLAPPSCLPILNHANRRWLGCGVGASFFSMQLCWSLGQTIQHLLVEHICWTICLMEIKLHPAFD